MVNQETNPEHEGVLVRGVGFEPYMWGGVSHYATHGQMLVIGEPPGQLPGTRGN